MKRIIFTAMAFAFVSSVAYGASWETAGNLTTPVAANDTYFTTYTDSLSADGNGGAKKLYLNGDASYTVRGDGSLAVVVTTESDPIFINHAAYDVTSTLIGYWDTAYGWGDHAGLYEGLLGSCSSGQVKIWSGSAWACGDQTGGSSVITDQTGTANRVLYVDGSGDVTELAYGASGTVLQSNGTTSAPSFAAVTGSGNVTTDGSATSGLMAYWDSSYGLSYDAGFSYNATTNVLTVGSISANAVGVNMKGSYANLLYNDEVNLVSDAAYGSGWNGSFQAASQNAIYDKIETLSSAAPEGTAVLSTGETGGTKYLREDGDGTSSWQPVTGSSSGVTEGTAVPTTLSDGSFYHKTDDHTLYLGTPTGILGPSPAWGWTGTTYTLSLDIQDNLTSDTITVNGTAYSTTGVNTIAGLSGSESLTIAYGGTSDTMTWTGTDSGDVVTDTANSLYHIVMDENKAITGTFSVSPASEYYWDAESDALNTGPVSSMTTSGIDYLAAGKVGQGVTLNADADVVNVIATDLPADGTVEIWFKSVNVANYDNLVGHSETDELVIARGASATDMSIKVAGGSSSWTGIPDIYDGSGHDIKLIYSVTNSTLELVIDNVSQGQVSKVLTAPSTTGNIIIGNSDAGNRCAQGVYDEFKITAN